MNRLNTAKRVQVVAALVEGSSINSIVRMTGVAKHTILKLIEDMGCACAAYHHRHVRGSSLSAVYSAMRYGNSLGRRRRTLRPNKRPQDGAMRGPGSDLSADTKLCVSYLVGGRVYRMGNRFHARLRIPDLVNRPQITTDAHKPYLKAVEEAFRRRR